MADDKKDDDDDVIEEPSKMSGSSEKIKGPERPTPTIELEAEEVTERDEKSDDSGAGAEAEDETTETAETPGGDDGEAAEQVWGKPDSESDEPAPGQQSASGETDATPDHVVATYSEPPRTRMSQLSGFFTHLAAGLIGGLIAVIAMGAGVERWLLGELGGTTPPAQIAAPQFDASGLETQIKALDARVDELGKAAQPSGPNPETQKTVAVLEERTAKLEQQASQKTEQTSDDADRLRRLEAALKNLSDTAKQDGNTVAPVAGVLAQINEFASGFDTKLLGLQDQVKKLESQAGEVGDSDVGGEIATLKSQAQTLSGDVSQLRQRIENDDGEKTAEALGGVEQRIATLEADVKRLSQSEAKERGQGRSAALAIAFANLQRGVDGGGAYRNELDTLKGLAPAGTDLTALQGRAASGIPTNVQLINSFQQYADATFDAAAAPQSDQLLDRLAAGARSLVQVRRGGEPEGNTPDAVIARMQASLKDGDLAKAAEQGNALEGKAREAMQPWMDSVSNRLAADRELDVLERKLLGAIGGAQGAGSG